MSQTLYFLTATLLTAQVGEPVPVQGGPVPSASEGAPGAYDSGWRQASPRVGHGGVLSWFHDRIGGLFGRHRQSDPSGQGPRQVMPQQPINFNEPPLAQPSSAPAPSGSQQSQNGPEATVAQASHESGRNPLNLAVNPKFREQIGHEADYSWITGQLYRMEAEGRPLWVIRYATEEIQDAHGGTVVLVPTADMHNYRNGDLVSVQGQILNGGAHSEQVGAPLYRASDINLIERGE